MLIYVALTASGCSRPLIHGLPLEVVSPGVLRRGADEAVVCELFAHVREPADDGRRLSCDTRRLRSLIGELQA